MLRQVQHGIDWDVTLNSFQGLEEPEEDAEKQVQYEKTLERHPEFISGSISYLILMKQSFIYMLSNERRSMLYIGVTSNLYNRVVDHKSGKGSIFTKKYNLKVLLYFEEFSSIDQAIAREKQLKNWHKEWKWNLIKKLNPDLEDLFVKLGPG